MLAFISMATHCVTLGAPHTTDVVVQTCLSRPAFRVAREYECVWFGTDGGRYPILQQHCRLFGDRYFTLGCLGFGDVDDAAVHALLHCHHGPIGRDVAPLQPEYFARPQSRELPCAAEPAREVRLRRAALSPLPQTSPWSSLQALVSVCRAWSPGSPRSPSPPLPSQTLR